MAEVLYGVCAAFFVLIISAVWYVLRSHYYQLGFKIPGPPGLPLLGASIDVFVHRHDFLRYFKELRGRYGPVIKLWAGPHLVVGLADPTDVAVILNSSKTLSKPLAYRPLSVIFGKSLLTAEKDEWKKFRKIMEPTFTPKIIDTYVSTFYEKSRVMADLLEEHANEQPFDILDYTMMCTLEMISETSLGVPMDIQGGKEQHNVIVNFVKLAEIASHILLLPWFWFICILKLTRVYRDNIHMVESIRDFICVLVKQKTVEYLHSKNSSAEHEHREVAANTSLQKLGFLERMTSVMVSNPGLLTEEDLRDQAMFVVGAAMDTSAYTVAYTLMLLGLHQDVQQKVMQEQEDIFGEDMHRSVAAEDLKKMIYLEQVINETMRLFPIVPLIARRVDEEISISNYVLPAGTTIVIPIFLVHREPAHYPEPDKFDPDRFNQENKTSRPSCSFIPFASGPRICIGKNYAYKAMKTMLSEVIRRYEVLECVSKDDMEHVKYQFLLKIVNGCFIKLRVRK